MMVDYFTKAIEDEYFHTQDAETVAYAFHDLVVLFNDLCLEI